MDEKTTLRLLGETLALANVCSFLAAEIASLDPAPQGKLADMLARMQGRVEGGATAIQAARPEAPEAASAMSAIMDHVSRQAVAALNARPRSGG